MRDPFSPKPEHRGNTASRGPALRKHGCFGARLVVLISLAVATLGHASLEETRALLEQWVKARQSISQTKAKWDSDKEAISQTSQLYQRELDSIEELMSNLSTNNVQVEKERAEAEASMAQSEAALVKAQTFAAAFETELAKLVPRLPGPLQESLKPSLDKLPADPTTATNLLAPARLQNLVSILNEIDKFNNAVTIYPESRKNNQGHEIAVQTVYVGLGAAYFVNESGDFAGIGSPGADGWDWTIDSGLAGRIREVIRIYRNERTARFVELPVTIK